MSLSLALVLALAPLARAAGPVGSDLGAEVKWDILAAAKHARSEVADACLWKAEAHLEPKGDRFIGHFWSEKEGAYYQSYISAPSEVPSDLDKGDVGVSPVCIRDVPIGADRAIAISMKHGLKLGVAPRVSLELIKLEKESMGDGQFVYNNVRAARGRLVWIVVPDEMTDLRNAWIIDAVAGRFIAHGDYTSVPMDGD
ncbi:MAG TPA: hypothetical protein VN915_07275 [Elusimicrobiota bacterium]|nr:hypothetical protein [Elusimicrobiota bacterium]